MSHGLATSLFRIPAIPLRWAAHRLIGAIDRMTGTSNDYLRHIVDTSLGAFVDFLLFTRMASPRGSLPRDAAHLARILATRSVDCGVCVQTTVNMALRDGVRVEWIEAALDGAPERLPAELRDVHDFVGHILAHTYEEGALREVLRARYGEDGLIELAYAVAAAQVFPYTKKVLGFANSCSLVRVQLPAA